MTLVRYLTEGIEATAEPGETLLEVSQRAGAPEGSHCGGVCGCSTCHVYVRAGMTLLSPPQRDEEQLLATGIDVLPSSRLGCQAVIVGEGVIELEIADESFETYLDDHPDDRDRALALRGIG